MLYHLAFQINRPTIFVAKERNMFKKAICVVSLFFVQHSVQADGLKKTFSFGKLAHDVVLFYSTYMITSIAHELGHALVYWCNNLPSRVIINANQERINKNYKELSAQKKRPEEEVPFPSVEINPIPSFYSVCVSNKRLSKTQKILCGFAGPVAGATTSVLLSVVFPRPFLFDDMYESLAFSHLANLVPFNLFGIKSDGYHIVKALGVI